MEGLKNRWLTERISTDTRAPPTSPSADPKPVMLFDHEFISIDEIPAHPIVVRLARHDERRNQRVPLAEEIAKLPRHRRVEHTDLEQRRKGSIADDRRTPPDSVGYSIEERYS